MSNTFISVVLCPCVMSYLLMSNIYLLPWYYPYCSTLYILPILWISICSILSLSICILLILISGLLYDHIYIINFLWYRYSIREYTSTYISNINVLSVLIFGIILSESLFFITFFWLSFQSFCYYLHSLEGIYMSDPNVLTFINTFLLSVNGLSLGYALLHRDVYRLHLSLPLLYVHIIVTFITIQIKEYSVLCIYMNESVYISAFFFLLGLHFFHVVVGIVLIVLIIYFPCYSRSALNFISVQLIVTPHLLFSTLQLVYWHFVDILWLFLYYILYN